MKKALILGFAAISFVTLYGCGDNDSKDKSKAKTPEQSQMESRSDESEKRRLQGLEDAKNQAKASREEKEAKEQEKKETASRKFKEAREAEKNKPINYQKISYDEMARNGDKHKGEKLQISGKVLQVTDTDEGGAMLRVSTRDNIDDVYIVDISKDLWKDKRLLEDDVVTFYGTVYGLYSYSSTGSGKITVPALITVFY